MLRKISIKSSLGLAVAVALSLGVASPASAASVRVTRVGEAPKSGSDIKACRDAAVLNAVIQGVGVVVKRTPGGENLTKNEIEQLTAADGVVKTAEPQEFGEEKSVCLARVRIIVDADALAAALRKMNESHMNNARIGVVLRYLIDGQPAEQAGFSVAKAQAELMGRLSDHGLQAEMVGSAAEWYQQKKIKQGSATGTGSSEEINEEKNLTDSGMDEFIKDIIIESKKMEEKDKVNISAGTRQMASFKYLTLGDVRIDRKGMDKMSPVFLAYINGQIRIVEIRADGSFADVGTSGELRGDVEGPTQSAAVSNAMQKMAVEAAAIMVGRLRRNAARTQ